MGPFEPMLSVLIERGGLAGLAAAALAYVCYRLQQKLQQVQDQRTQDAQDVLPQVVELVQAQNGALTQLATALEALKTELEQRRRGH